MVEINNQRKAFLDMLACGGAIRRQKTKNHGYDVIVGAEGYFTELLRSPRKLVTLNPKLKSTSAGRYQLLCPLVGLLPQAAWPERLLSEKSGRCWQCCRLRSVALYLWLIVVDIRQAIDRCSNIWASLPGAGAGQFQAQADGLIAKFKEAGGTVRDWCMSSHRDYLRSGYLHHRLPVMGC